MLASARDQQSMTQRTWSPFKSGYCKVNIDVAIKSKKQISGLGAVIRDEFGNVIATAIKSSKFNGDMAFAEDEAMECGMQIAGHEGLSCLVIESDSQEVVNLVNDRQGSRTEIFWFISKIQNLVKGFDKLIVNMLIDLVMLLPIL